MTFPPLLRQRQALVDRALARILGSLHGAPPVLSHALRYCVYPGGKRFRPLLCFGACEAVGVPARRALPVACALELIHTYSLVHDDLPAMDNADERRGKPSCHRRFGEANAILVGDALLTLAFDRLSRNGTPNTLAIIRTVGQACGAAGLIGGQVLDLQAGSQRLQSTVHRPPSTVKQLEDVARRKTGALITASVVTGALAGGGSAAQVKRLQRYGAKMGLAFQLIDDLHDGEGMSLAMGPEALCARARRVVAEAVAALAPFGARADALRALAWWLARSAGTRSRRS
ncbi:MAG: polyprenyl synthetase family protein [Candidatus Omnitrophota bacterium]|nr:polyprenyl synthetase family protein [Candidatus Omnitrophota bacterium]